MFRNKKDPLNKKELNFRASNIVSDLLTLGFKGIIIVLSLGLTLKCGKVLNMEIEAYSLRRSNQIQFHSRPVDYYTRLDQSNEIDSEMKQKNQQSNASELIAAGKEGYLLLKEIALDLRGLKQPKGSESYEQLMGEKIRVISEQELDHTNQLYSP
jgi:hypothetical protein